MLHILIEDMKEEDKKAFLEDFKKGDTYTGWAEIAWDWYVDKFKD